MHHKIVVEFSYGGSMSDANWLVQAFNKHQDGSGQQIQGKHYRGGMSGLSGVRAERIVLAERVEGPQIPDPEVELRFDKTETVSIERSSKFLLADDELTITDSFGDSVTIVLSTVPR